MREAAEQGGCGALKAEGTRRGTGEVEEEEVRRRRRREAYETFLQ